MKDFVISPEGAYPFLLLEDKQFLKQCRLDAYAASGPGGQKRNRTYSAVRITHGETGLTAIAEESRSQAENRLRALKRLRMAIAFHIRKQTTISAFRPHEKVLSLFQGMQTLQINKKNPLYPLFCATLLDAFFAVKGKIGDASQLLAVSSGRLNRALGRDTALLGAANHLRQHFGLKSLRI